MAYRTLQAVVCHIRRMAGASDATGSDDAQLLTRFVSQRDEAAFETLVRRHGPMVLGVCQRLLPNPYDCEDAFQVTFLVLLRKAGSLRQRELLASWLYGVAYRTAMKARSLSLQRQSRERQLVEEPATEANAAGDWRELRPVLDEEIQRLPENYRKPLILCYLNGKTFSEAARELGWPEGTVSGRLARARQLLRKRLTRRGLALTAGLAGATFSDAGLSAAVPAPFLALAVKTAVLVASANTVIARVLPMSVAALMEGVLHSMYLTKMKLVILLIIGFALMGVGAGLARYQYLAAQPPAGQAQTGGGAARPAQSAAVPNPRQQLTEDQQLDALLGMDFDRWNKAVDATTLSNKLKTLLKERLLAARRKPADVLVDFRAARGMLELLVGASGRLRDAELEMSPKQADQVEALEGHWKRMKMIEEIINVRTNRGLIIIQDYDESRYHRLNAEIALELARTQPRP